MRSASPARVVKRQAIIVFSLLGLLAATAIIAVVVIVTILVNQIGTKNYLPVAATVTKSEVKITHGKSTSYKPVIHYRYTVAGTDYTSSRIKYTGAAGGKSASTAMVTAHPVGATVTAYYDPREPSRSVLFQGLAQRDYILPMLVAPIMGLPIGVLVYFADAGIAMSRPWRRFGLVRAWEEGGITRVRLRPTLYAWLAGIGVSMVVGFIAAFVVPVTPLGGSMTNAAIAGAFLIVVGILVGMWRRRPIIRGDSDLVLDPIRKTLTMPQNRTLAATSEIAFRDVEGVDVRQTQRSRKAGPRWSVGLRTGAAGYQQLTQFGNQADAELLAAWLRVQAGRPAGE